MEHFGVKMVDGTYTSKFLPSQNLTKTTRKAVFWFWFWFLKSLKLQGEEGRGEVNSKNNLEAERWMDES